jgi:hypothetical protein
MITIPLVYWLGGAVIALTLITVFYLISCSCKNIKT